MKIIVSLLVLVIFVSFIIMEVEAACSDGNCRAIQRYNAFGVDYTGSQYDIRIPDLFIDTANCDQKAAVATTWVHIEPTRDLGLQWIETGVTVGWIKNNDYDRNDSECISVESAYYGISAFDVDPEERTIEQNADPHGDNIGTEKSFRIEKLNNHYLAYYGDSNSQNLIRDYSFGERHNGIGADYGIEGTISPILEYSSIPNVKSTNVQYKTGNTWNDISSFAVTHIDDEDNGYKSQLCGTGSMVAGAVTEISCSAPTVHNTAPIHTATDTYTTTGTAVIIPLTAEDADNDYLKYSLVSHPTNTDGAGFLDHVNLLAKIPNTGDTSAKLLFTPSREGTSSFDYAVTDGRTGHSVTNTITVNIPNLDDISSSDLFYDSFENGLGNWIAVNDDDGDTHDYDFWKTGTDGQASSIDGNYAYIRDCDTGCTLTMRNAVDLRDTTLPRLEADIWVDAIRERDGDYYNLDILYDDNWITLDSYTRDTISNGQWIKYTKDLSSYADESNFKFRLSVQGEGSTDYHIMDNLRIYDFIQTEPSMVTDLDVTATPTSATLTWSTPFDGNSEITGYKIKRADGNPSGYSTIENSYGDASTASYVDSDISSGTTYYYKISARNDQGVASESQYASATIPHLPSNPVISAISDMTMYETDNAIVTVTVSDLNNDVQSIAFGDLPDFVTIHDSTQNTSTLFVSPTPGSSGVYDIVVTATDATSLSDTENFSITIMSANTAPQITISQPLDNSIFDDDGTISFAATATDSQDVDISADMTWSSNLDGVIGTGRSFSAVLSEGIHTITASVTDSGGESSDSQVNITIQNIREIITIPLGDVTISTDAGSLSNVSSVDESTMPAQGRPAVSFPYDLFSFDVTGLESGQTVTLNMTYPDSIPDDSQYWKIQGNTWINATSLLGSNDGDDTITLTITDGGLGDADGEQDGSITDPGGIAILSAAPGSPTNLALTVESSTQIDLSWTAPPDDGGSIITGYRIERNLNSQGFETLIQNTDSDSTTYSDTSLSPGDSVEYRVSAINQIGTSAPSNVTSAVTPTHPTILSAQATSHDTIILSADQILTDNGTAPSDFAVSAGNKDVIVSDITIFGKTITIKLQGDWLDDSDGITVSYAGNAITGDSFLVLEPFDIAPTNAIPKEIEHLSTFGSYGENSGEFDSPMSIATNSTGHIYVTDTENSRIQIFDGVGNYLSEIAETDSIPLDYPRGITIHEDAVYVADYDGIMVFDGTGQLQLQFGSYGTADGQFRNPTGILVYDEKIYITDSSNNRVQVFDEQGNFLFKFGSHGYDDGQFRLPMGIDEYDGFLYIADCQNDRIQVFDGTGNYIREYGVEGNNPGELDEPAGMDIDSMGNMYIADYYNDRIQIFSHIGQYLHSFGSTGSNDGEFDYPIDVTVDEDGKIYVADYNNNRIQVLQSPVTQHDTERSPTYNTILDVTGNFVVNDSTLHQDTTIYASGTNSPTVDLNSMPDTGLPSNLEVMAQSTSTILYANTTFTIDGQIPQSLDLLEFASSSYDDGTIPSTVNVGTIIDIGPDDQSILLSQPARITLHGTSGMAPFYVESEQYHSITTQCISDDLGAVSSQLTDNECYVDNGTDIIIWTVHFTSFGAGVISAPAVEKTKPGGGDDLWKTKPTFGISHTTDRIIVQCGFLWDGICYDITDNWHTPFEKVPIQTGKNYTGTIKGYFQHPPLFVEFGLVPELGAMHKAETKVEILFEDAIEYHPYEDVTQQGIPSVKSVSVIQEDNIMDARYINATMHKVSCGYVAQDCYEITINNISFREVPFFEKIAIIAADNTRRTQTTYLNDGFGITGESYNEPRTADIAHHSKRGLFSVTQTDKFANLWEDNDGIQYTHNDVNTWIRITPHESIDRNDPDSIVMNRNHSGFTDIIEYEKKRAEKLYSEKYYIVHDPDEYEKPEIDYTRYSDHFERYHDSWDQYVIAQQNLALQYLDEHKDSR